MFFSLHPEAELGRISCAFREMVEGKKHSIFDTKVLKKDGETIPVDITGGAITYRGKQVTQGIFRDITDRKEIEKQLKDYQEHLERLVEERTKELKQSEEKYRNIFENAVEGIFQTTPEGRFLKVNPALPRMCGYETPEELVRSITNLATEIYTDPERRKHFMDLIERDGTVRNFEVHLRTRDGSIKYAFMNARAVKDEDGKTLYFEGTVQDVTEKKLAVEQMMLQRNLAVKLSQIDRLEECTALILEAVFTASGMECGGISLKNSETGGFDLIRSIGLTNDFQEKIRYVTPGSFTWSRMIEKKSFHIRPNKELTPIALEEGFQFISVMPMLQGDEVVGFLVMASKAFTEIPEQVRVGLEVLVAESGNIIARIQTRERLEVEIITRRDAERALAAKSQSLEEANTALTEANTALKVLLKHREEDRKELEENVVANVRQLVMPYVEKLKKNTVDPVQQTSIGLVESNLTKIISPFLRTMLGFKFTPRQLEVATLIKEGRTTKDIAGVLNISKRAVEIQRFLIRKKLGLNKDKTNLQAYLKSLS